MWRIRIQLFSLYTLKNGNFLIILYYLLMNIDSAHAALRSFLIARLTRARATLLYLNVIVILKFPVRGLKISIWNCLLKHCIIANKYKCSLDNIATLREHPEKKSLLLAIKHYTHSHPSHIIICVSSPHMCICENITDFMYKIPLYNTYICVYK